MKGGIVSFPWGFRSQKWGQWVEVSWRRRPARDKELLSQPTAAQRPGSPPEAGRSVVISKAFVPQI